MSREAVVNAATGAFQTCLLRYRDYASAPAGFSSPNPDDDEYSKLAIAGFSSVATTERWSWEHFAAIRELRMTELSDEALAWHGPHAQQYARFACMCYGALVGLRDIGALKDEDDFEIAEAVMPGFIMANLEEIYGFAERHE
jgi:hypothetical protein